MGSFQGGAHGERVEREPVTGVWALGQSPQRGPGAEPLVPEAESFLALGRAPDRANLYPLQYFQQSITIIERCKIRTGTPQ